MNLRIRTIARLTGVREGTLRAWERRYGFPHPSRSENNYRVYGREEVEAIRRVARLMEEGLSVSEAIAQVRQTPVAELPARERLVERFWSAVMVMDADEAARVLDEAEGAMPQDVYADGLLMPLLREMGLRLDVAREHMASALIRQRLHRLLTQAPSPASGPRALLACPARDHHEGGLLALGLALKRRGWRVTYLGADTPPEALGEACRQVHPDVVALSVVRQREPDELARLLGETVGACAPAPVVVGGPAARGLLRCVYAAGAHYAESADELVSVVQQVRNTPEATRG